MGKISFLLSLLIVGALTSCRSPKSPSSDKPSGNSEQKSPILRMDKLKLQSFGRQGVEWELSAPSGQLELANNLMQSEDLTIHIFEDGKNTAVIQAKKGYMIVDQSNSQELRSYDLKDNVVIQPGDFYMEGSVVVKSSEGNTLFTEWLHYKKKIDLIVTDAPVRVEGKDSVTEGIGMQSTPDLKDIKIFNQTITIPEKSPS